MSLPKVHNKVLVETIAEDVHRITMHIENRGYLPTAGLQRALDLKLTKETHVELVCPDDVELIGGVQNQSIPALDGWGPWQTQSAKNLLYPSLPMRGNRQALQWVVRGIGSVEIHWQCSRAGSGVERVSVGKEAIEQ